MKRWGIFLLTLAMLFAVAGAEEVFVEESFLDTGVQGEEFFAEESFFGDAFEAEASVDGAEAGAEDRSVYLMESETPPDAELATDWQKWYVKVTPDTVKTGSKKITLNFSLFTDQACTVPAAPAGKIGKGAYAGVKFYIYDVDPITGIPEEVAKKATTAMKTSITVKNPGDYTFYVRLEKVDGNGSELYGHASEKVTVTVTETDKDYAISKLKLSTGEYDFYAETDVVPDKPNIVAVYENYDIGAQVYTKKVADRYIVTAQTKDGRVYTGTYTIDPEDKLYAFIDGYFWLNFKNVMWGYNIETKERENIPDPVITSKGKKLTITVTPEKIAGKDPETGYNTFAAVGKAKKAAIKLAIDSKVTPKTPPIITNIKQIDATTVQIKWSDPASFYFFKATGYTLTYGKTKVPLTMDKITQTEKDTYSYLLKMTAVSKPTKMKFTVQAVTEDKVKPKKSKAYTKMILPQSGFFVYDVSLYETQEYDEINNIYYDVARVTWKGLYDAVDTYEVYLTDSKHTTDIAKKKVSADKTKTESYNKETGEYFVDFKVDEYDKLTDGTHLGVVVKAMGKNGVVLGRATDWYWENDNYRRTVSLEQEFETAEYTAAAFSSFDLFKAVDEEGNTYKSIIGINKILYNDGINPETEVTEVREVGKYKITAEIKNKNGFKDVAEKEYSFEVRKRTLVISLYENSENLVLADSYGYSFDASDVRIRNGEDHYLNDIDTLRTNAKVTVKDSKGEVVAGNLIKQTGDYTVEVIITADLATTDGLTPTSDPTKGTKTVTLPFTVSEKKLYIHAEAEQTGWVGEAIYSNSVYNGPEFSIVDVNGELIDSGYPYYVDSDDIIVTFTVTGKDGNINLGDISQKAGEYAVTINATCEGWKDADPVTIKVTIVETHNTTLEGWLDTASFPYGNLSIDGSDLQYKEYDGSAKLPDFTIKNQGGNEVTAKYYVRISDKDGNIVDAATEIGWYRVTVRTNEPGYSNVSRAFNLYITEPWTLRLKQETIMETGSQITPEFVATSGKVELAVNDNTKTTYVDCEIDPSTLKRDGVSVSSIEKPGKYTFGVEAYVWTKNEKTGYYEEDNTYAPIMGNDQVFTLTVTDAYTLSLETKALTAKGKSPWDDLDFIATDLSTNNTIDKYDADTAPDGWSGYIEDISIIKDGKEWSAYNTVSQAGTHKIYVIATWNGITKEFEFTFNATDTWTLELQPTVSIASTNLPIAQADLIEALPFTATDKNGKFERYDSSASPAQTLYFNITDWYFYDEDNREWVDDSDPISAGKYIVEVYVKCGGTDATSEHHEKKYVAFPLTVIVE